MGKIRKPELHPNLIEDLKNLNSTREELNAARKQILENAIQINILQNKINFGLTGGYFTDDLSDIDGTPIQTGIFNDETKRFMMP